MGLGIWLWTCLRVREEINTRYISACKSCENKKGLTKSWTQQVKYFPSVKSLTEPNQRELFDRDL